MPCAHAAGTHRTYASSIERGKVQVTIAWPASLRMLSAFTINQPVLRPRPVRISSTCLIRRAKGHSTTATARTNPYDVNSYAVQRIGLTKIDATRFRCRSKPNVFLEWPEYSDPCERTQHASEPPVPYLSDCVVIYHC